MYPDGDTFSDRFVESGIPFPDMDPGAPDGCGFSAPTGVFATGAIRIDGDDVTVAYSEPPEGSVETAVDGGNA